MRYLILIAAACVACLTARPSHASSKDYITELHKRADKLQLHKTKRWRRLLHYRSTTFGGWESEADGTGFFLSKNGKTDPRAELRATIAGFFARGRSDDALMHPQCRFPARLLWLHRKLNLDPKKLKRRKCNRFQEFRDSLDAIGATVIFSSYHLNSPASSFGHTFLRLNKRPSNTDTERRELLDYGIDYSALVDTNNALLYALKGLFGLFPGTFRKVPYYYKVREYNDYESRDLWEYELDLNKDQLRYFVAHLWELGSTHFAYYFLTENCSYHILGALEVAAPRRNLLKGLSWPVIPADTVKALTASPGLVKSIGYRPSNRAKFHARIADLTEAERSMLLKLLKSVEAPFPSGTPTESKVRILDAAADWADLTYPEEMLEDGAVSVGAQYKQRILERRVDYLVESQEIKVPSKRHQRPDLSHGSKRFLLGSGYDSELGAFHHVGVRFALHDLVDPTDGYPETMQIEFLPTRFRYLIEDPTLWVEEATFVRIKSLTEQSEFVTETSWTAQAGAERIRDAGCDCLAATFAGSIGASLGAADSAVVAYWLLGAKFQALAPIDGIGGLPLRLGPTNTGGLRLRAARDFILLGQAEWHWIPGQAAEHAWTLEGHARYSYRHDLAVGAEIKAQPNAWATSLSSFLYFH